MKKKVEEALPTLPEKSNNCGIAKLNLQSYFSKKNQTLGSLMLRVEQIKHWQTILFNCLPQEKEIFNHCHVVHADQSSLMILAENPHWIGRLRFLIPQILSVLQQNPNYARLKNIYCKVRPPLYNNRLSQKRPSRQRLAISENSAKEISSAAERIRDPKVCRALKKLAARADKIE